jgi:hypothetical protein
MQNTPRFGSEEWRLAYSVAPRVLKRPDQAVAGIAPGENR